MEPLFQDCLSVAALSVIQHILDAHTLEKVLITSDRGARHLSYVFVIFFHK